METREELITKLERAYYLMNNTIELQERRTNIRLQYIMPIESKEPFMLKKQGMNFFMWLIKLSVFISVVGFLTNIITSVFFPIIWIINGRDLFLTIKNPLGIALYAGSIFLCHYLINKFIAYQNKKINIKNAEIAEGNRNSATYEAEIEVIELIKNTQEQYTREISPWYPSNYCSVDAAGFFLNIVKNFRADNMKEAINLYEDALHKRKMEQTQQQMLENQGQMVRQQSLNNMLSIGNMIMQAGTQNSIDRNTSSTNNVINTLNRKFRDR